MKTYQLAWVPGDGIGREVTLQGVKALNTAAEKYDFILDWTEYDLGSARYLKTGELLPESVLEEFKQMDAIYLGAVGHPDVKPGILEQGLLLKLRFELDQYINLRPIKLYTGVECPVKDKGPDDIDYIVVRENTEGLYAHSGGSLRKDTVHEVAIQESVNTYLGVERCLRYAFELAKERPRKKLTLCGKTNVLTHGWGLWERVFNTMKEEYPDVEPDYAHVDATCMWMVKNPEWFDVIVTDNMFGDIITDLGAITQGGLGVAAGGNINPDGVSMFEFIGGSAPKYENQNKANPIAGILAGQMLLNEIGEVKAAAAVEKAVMEVLPQMASMAAGRMGMTTEEVGDKVADAVT